MKITSKPSSASLFRADFPFSPAGFPVFYGWAILVASVLRVLTSIPGQTIGVSFFTDHLIAATELSRLALANAYLVGTLTSGCLLPFGGKLLDRLGARRVVVLAAVGLGITLAYLRRQAISTLAFWAVTLAFR